MVSQSIPMCRQRPAVQAGCRIPEHWRQFLEPDAARKWAGLVGDERTRKELIQSLETRNAESHPLSVVTPPDVVLFDRDPAPTGSSSLSLPGYSTDRHALVYGSYSCGSQCGSGWLFVLENVGGHWRVKSSTVTVVS